VPTHHDRRPVLARNRNDLRARVARLHQVAERRDKQLGHRGRILAAARTGAGDGFVLGAIDALVVARRVQVEIIVGDNAGARRMATGQNRRVAGACFGRAMRLVARRKDDPAAEPRQAAAEPAAIFGVKIGRELLVVIAVDQDYHEQLGRGRGGGDLLHRRRGILSQNGAAAADTQGGGESDFEKVRRHERRLRCTRVSARAVLSTKPAYMASLERWITAE
jgi:hypothetical protein